MSTIRKPSDGSSQEWSFVAPYLALLPEDVRQRKHDLLLSPQIVQSLEVLYT